MFETLFSLKDKVCVVTGGSRGLGSFMARGFLEAGAKRVYITARRAEACLATADELSKYGECIALPGDISSLEEIEKLVETLSARESRVNAIAPGRFFSKMTEYVSQDQAAYEAECEIIPLHRWGGETDIAGVAIMLASQAGAFITGQIIPVDGGSTLVS